MDSNPVISFVSPVYKAEMILDKLVAEINSVMLEIDTSFEVVLVDDRSPDNSWAVMQRISETHSHVKSIRLSRNFGQHPAIMAGLEQAKGEWVVVMDCDLQDQPNEVIKLYQKAKEGFDVVLANRKNRQDGFLKKLSSKLFSVLYSYLTDTKFDSSVANFGIYNQKVIREVLRMNDTIKSFPLFINWVGFNSTTVTVEHSQRFTGDSTYTFSKLLSLAFNTIISFSNKPLKLFVKFGLLMSLISVLLGFYTLYRYSIGEIKVMGYSSLIVSIWFLSGTIITVVGVVGIYVGKIFNQSKNRPSYIIDTVYDRKT